MLRTYRFMSMLTLMSESPNTRKHRHFPSTKLQDKHMHRYTKLHE